MNRDKNIRSMGKLLALHLLPGVVIGIVYALLSKAGLFAAYPKSVTLGAAAVLSLIPLQLGILLYAAKKEEKSLNIFKILGLKSKMKIWEFILYTIIAFIITGLIITVLKPLSNYMLNHIFGWMPGWYNLTHDVGGFSKSAVITALLVQFFVLTLMAPIVEELYFRGYLLARMKWMGKYSVLLNVVLFSFYHFWSPWLIIARIAGMLPLYYLVYKKDSLKLAILVHCLCNLTDIAALFALL